MENIGFYRSPDIEGHEIVYKSRPSEFDDFFICENLLIIVEYTSVKEVSTHLLKKKVIYDLIDKNHREFIEFAISEPKLSSFKEYYDKEIKNKYSNGQIRIRILYCSIKPIDPQYKENLSENKTVRFYDYGTVHYFKSLAANIERSARFELLYFLDIKASDFGNSVFARSNSSP